MVTKSLLQHGIVLLLLSVCCIVAVDIPWQVRSRLFVVKSCTLNAAILCPAVLHHTFCLGVPQDQPDSRICQGNLRAEQEPCQVRLNMKLLRAPVVALSK